MRQTLYLICINLVFYLSLSSQNQENSPYSRFGLGEFTDPYLSAQGHMGGWIAAYADQNFVNYLNPASLGRLTTTSLEVGMYGRFNTIADRFSSIQQWGGNLSHLSLGIPIKNPVNDAINKVNRLFFWGTALTLTPYTRTSYNIRTIEFAEGIGRVRRNYRGDGGTYKLFWSNGVRYKNTSLGLNIGLLTGKIERDRIIALDDIPNSYTEFFEDKQTFRGFLWSWGIQHQIWIQKPNLSAGQKISRYFLIGGVFGGETTLFSQLDRTYTKSNDILKLVDTILSEQGKSVNTVLPRTLTLGVSYVQENKWRIGLDYHFERWSRFSNAFNTGELFDNWGVNGGLEYIPEINAIGRYFKKIRYRVGMRLGTDPRVVESQLNRFEVNIGMGLPFVRSREVSFMHLGLAYGSIFGDIPLQERYFRASLGFTFVDNSWFIKRKFY